MTTALWTLTALFALAGGYCLVSAGMLVEEFCARTSKGLEASAERRIALGGLFLGAVLFGLALGVRP